MPWVAPKTNWTVDDYYNYADVNRVEGNTSALAALIATFQAAPTLTGVKTDWAKTDIPSFNDINKIESNILALKTATAQPIGWVTPVTDWATLNIFDYLDTIRLENNLLALYDMANNIIAEFEYCGAITCGQEFNLGGY